MCDSGKSGNSSESCKFSESCELCDFGESLVNERQKIKETFGNGQG